MEPLLLRPAEAALMLSVSRTTVYDLVQAGKLPAIRIGSSVRIPVASLKSWVAQQQATVTGLT